MQVDLPRHREPQNGDPTMPRSTKSVLVTCKIPRELINAIDKMVEQGIFSSRSEAIRYAIGYMIATNGASMKTQQRAERSVWEMML